MPPVLGPIVCGTTVVEDLDQAIRAYTDSLGLVVQARGTVPHDLAGSWRAPRTAGSAYCIVGSTATRSGGIRLVQRDPMVATSPLRVPGWRCIEVAVADLHALRERLDRSPFRVVGEPAPIATGSPIMAMQVLGPGRVMLYLTETVANSGLDLPLAEHFVDRQFIAVLSAPDLDAALDWYVDSFGASEVMPPDDRHSLPAICADLGLPTGRQFRIGAVGLAGQSFVEVDDHPFEFATASGPFDDLKPGVALVTWEIDDLDAVRPLLLHEAVVRHGFPYMGRRTATAVGAAGECLEMIERSS